MQTPDTSSSDDATFNSSMQGTFVLEDVPVVGKAEPDYLLVGVDPGAIYPVTTDHGTNYSREKYYQCTGVKPRRKRGEKETPAVPAVHKGKGIPSAFVVERRKALAEALQAEHMHYTTVDDMLKGLKGYARLLSRVQAEWGSSRSVKRAFMRSRRTDARVPAILDVVFPPNMVQAFAAHRGIEANRVKKVAAFGKWHPGLTPQRWKYFPPIKGICRALARHCVIVYVDEHYTSKMCNLCHGTLGDEGEAVPGNDRPKVCTSCKQTVHRDVNGAINIRKVFEAHIRGEGRPDYLCRPPATSSSSSSSSSSSRSTK